MRDKKLIMMGCVIGFVIGILAGVYIHHQISVGAIKQIQKDIQQEQRFN